MALTREQIESIAALARLELTGAELPVYQESLSRILEFFGVLERAVKWARRYPGASIPRKAFLNCTIPALVKSSVGSSAGTSDELGRTWWPLRAK